MKHIWLWLKKSLTEDDLFLRVLFFLFGSAVGGGGFFEVFWLLTYDMQEQSAWMICLLWILALFFSAWGTVLFARSFLPLESKIARFAEKVVPDSADEGALVVAVVFCLPAVLFTVLLRQLGVRGE